MHQLAIEGVDDRARRGDSLRVEHVHELGDVGGELAAGAPSAPTPAPAPAPAPAARVLAHPRAHALQAGDVLGCELGRAQLAQLRAAHLPWGDRARREGCGPTRSLEGVRGWGSGASGVPPPNNLQ